MPQILASQVFSNTPLLFMPPHAKARLPVWQNSTCVPAESQSHPEGGTPNCMCRIALRRSCRVQGLKAVAFEALRHRNTDLEVRAMSRSDDSSPWVLQKPGTTGHVRDVNWLQCITCIHRRSHASVTPVGVQVFVYTSYTYTLASWLQGLVLPSGRRHMYNWIRHQLLCQHNMRNCDEGPPLHQE